MATITRGKTFASGETVTPEKLHQMVDNATVAAIENADISATAAISDTKLATISTGGKVANSATTATNNNTGNSIVARDASGNFSAGTITANLTGTASAVADNAVTTTKIAATPIESKTNNYQLVLADRNKIIEFNSTSNLTLTVPANSTAAFENGSIILVSRIGTGVVTISPASGVTIQSENSKNKIRSQFSTVALVKRSTNEWLLVGSLTT